jgi:hypothetical protein
MAEEPQASVSADLRPFFERYGRAFEAHDAGAIAACYAVPCLLVRDGTTVAHETGGGVEASVRSLLDLHRAWDVQTARPADVVVLEATPGHTVARVDWRLGRKGSRLAWTYSTTYTLVPAANGAAPDWRVAVAVTHDAPF